MIDPHDQKAAEVVAAIAAASRFRSENGQTFWGGYLRHRLERFRRLDLAHCVSRLMDACETSPVADSTRKLMQRISDMDQATTEGVQSALQNRPALIVALAYEQLKKQ